MDNEAIEWANKNLALLQWQQHQLNKIFSTEEVESDGITADSR